ncbi:MAG: response regulator, partial [Limisphaerales bacterium]
MKILKTILQVEDDLNDVYLLNHSLRKAGIECRLKVATDGKQAINYLKGDGEYADREKHPLPDLILLDLKLPCVMGLEVLQWIRRHLGSRIVVIVLTSSVLESDIEKAYALCANAFLIKPNNISVLQSMLKSACDFWFSYNTPPPGATSQSPLEGVVSLDRLGRPCELIPPTFKEFGAERTTIGFS